MHAPSRENHKITKERPPSGGHGPRGRRSQPKGKGKHGFIPQDVGCDPRPGNSRHSRRRACSCGQKSALFRKPDYNPFAGRQPGIPPQRTQRAQSFAGRSEPLRFGIWASRFLHIKLASIQTGLLINFNVQRLTGGIPLSVLCTSVNSVLSVVNLDTQCVVDWALSAHFRQSSRSRPSTDLAVFKDIPISPMVFNRTI